LAVRIFLLVDTVDALAFDCPYHRGADPSTVRKEILKRSGTHFDPELVGPVLGLLLGYFGSTARPSETE
jgi:HD-GYP domain-containing protein (c-di-GMP phosphodiesterase class II)